MPKRKKPRGKHLSPHLPKSQKAYATDPASSGPGHKAPKPSSAASSLPRGLALFILIAITLIAYFNAWPNQLTFDDRLFADSSRFAGMGLSDVGRFFTEDLWAGNGARSNLYRPLLLVLIWLESLIFGGWFAGYHLVNILLHVLATVLVYGLVRHLLLAWGNQPSVSNHSALLAATIFGVHPIHTEVVNSIFNGSELLVCIGVVGGLWWFQKTLKDSPPKAWFGLSAVYLLILFCRESGAALPVLAVAMVWISSSEPWLLRMRKCLPVFVLLIPLAIYLMLRAHALAPPETTISSSIPLPNISMEPSAEPQVEHQDDSVGVVTEPAVEQPARTPDDSAIPAEASGLTELISRVSLAAGQIIYQPQQLLPAAGLWFESWKKLLWPHPLQVYYDPPDRNIWLVLATQLALLAVAMLAYIRKQPGLLAGLSFFYLGILPSSKLFGGIYFLPDLADRILYLPSVGLAIIIAAGLSILMRRLSLRSAVFAALLVTMIFIPLTWARNAEWADDIVLFEHDYAKLENKQPILNTLLAAHLREKNFGRVAELCDSDGTNPYVIALIGVHCGSAYGNVGRYSDAERAYTSATQLKDSRVFAHFNLAMMYTFLGRSREATEQFELAIAAEPSDFMKEYFTALMVMQLHPNEREKLIEAKQHLERALQLQPQHALSRQELNELNARLSPAMRSTSE